MAKPSFCDIPINIRNDMPVGVMVLMSGDGKTIIPVVNLDIEVCGTLPPGPPLIEYGQREITGTFEAKFEDPDVFAKFLCRTDSMAKLVMAAIVKLGDELAAKGKLNRHGRKHWRTHRNRMAAYVRREEARERRAAYGLASF